MTTSDLPDISPQQQTEIEAALFRKLLTHLREHPEVQNIDLMNTAYFCRNCFSKWYVTEAEHHDIALENAQAREIVYGMPYAEYKQQHQAKANEEQLAKFGQAQDNATD